MTRGNMAGMAQASIPLAPHGFLLSQPLENFRFHMIKPGLHILGEYREPE